jgi:uncharacterized OB-fold protein
MTDPRRPLPNINAVNSPFWASVRNRRMELPQCIACGSFHWPLCDRCPHCLADQFNWVAVAGTGRILSFVIFHQLYHPAFKNALPYNVSIIELDEGPRLVSTVLAAKECVRIGKRVRVEYEDLDESNVLHRFVIDES